MSHNENNSTFDCVVIGGTTLLIRCAEILSDRGHQIKGLFSSDPLVVRWGLERGVDVFEPATIEKSIEENSVDYLFSVVNERILTTKILASPRRLAINYHDAPLPKYAGTHATSWALLNREKEHGVSWHIASEQVDAGDILKQRSVTIDATDTAFTLNTKCYEAAIDSFVELVDDLSFGRSVSQSQDLEKRTFFPRFKRPVNAGILSWRQSADDIAATVRALDFGPHPNALGSAKTVFDGKYFLVRSIEVLDEPSTSEPGTIVGVTQNTLTVATGSSNIRIRLATIEGQTLSPKQIFDQFAADKSFDQFDDGQLQAIAELNALCASHEKFWVRKLEDLRPFDCPYLLHHVSDSPRSFVTRSIDLPPATIESPNSIDLILAAWAAFFFRITSADSFDLGFKDRSEHADFDRYADLFSSVVPLRIEVDDSQNLGEFARSFNKVVDEVRRHQTYLRDLPARYSQIDSLTSEGSQLKVQIELVETAQHESQSVVVDASITIRIAKDGSRCLCVYDQDAFEPEDAERMALQFETFVQGYVANPDWPISKLPLLPADERHQLLIEWNATETSPSKYECIHHLFESQVGKTPDKPAVIFDDEVTTYRELNDRANQLTQRLRKLGVGPESLVGICCSRSTDLIVGLLGILKAGGAYVPLDSSYPAERLAFIVEDADLKVIVAQQELLSQLPPHQAQVVCLNSDRKRFETEAGTDLAGGKSSDLAYLIYTSGSTGKPKGVAIEHRSAVVLLEWAQTVFTAEELSGVLASTSICFDLSIFEIFVPLSCGGAVILAENALHLPTLRHAGRVTLVNTVPSAMTELIRMKGLPGSLLTVNLAGEALVPALVDQIYRETSASRVFDLYGPSEDTTYSTFALRRPNASATIGRPIANTQAYILDRNLEPLPIGVPGELYLGGAGLARGYLDRPELTAERFISNPFGSAGSRLYRTGDLARYRPDGNLEYLGRIDHQVKIRGFRIELGEIQAVINQHPSVLESVVIAHEDGSGANLAAYVVPRKGSVPTTLELREFLKEKVPPFMVPTFVTVLDALPLTPNGKLDRKALPEPETKGIDSGGTFVAPSNSVERFLTKTWEEILKRQPIGVEDNFFELGGHSLLAVELFVRVESKFGKKIPLATLFQAPTIKQLASLIGASDDVALPSLVAIQPHGSKPPFFCIHARGGNVLFYRDLSKRLGPDQPFYGLQMVGIDGKRPFQTSIEDMAAHYLKEIKEICPNGPYLLGGASFGGTAAYEMAQQLLKQGEQVALLALFDTTGPGYPRPLPSTSRTRTRMYGLIRSFQHRVSSLRLLSTEERVDYLKKQASRIRVRTIRFGKRTSRKIAQKLPKQLRSLLFSPSTNAPWALLETERAINHALKNYTTRPYRGRLTLFRASKQPMGIYPDPTLGWGELVTGELVIHEVPGFHGTIVAEPHVRFLAEKLTTCIDEAQQEFAAIETSSRVQAEMTHVPLMMEQRLAV